MKKAASIPTFSREMQKKLRVVLVLFFLCFAALSVRLFFIFRDNGQSYKRQVYAQRNFDSKTIPFKRGDIVDRKGSKLAYSEKVYNIVLDAKLMLSDEGKYYEPTMAAIKKYLPMVDSAKVERLVAEHPESQYKVLVKKQDYDDIRPYQEYEQETRKKKDLDRICGIFFIEDYKRKYPNGRLACDLVGFVQGENNGLYGLEEYYNSTLNGVNGRTYGYLGDDSMIEQTIKPASDGDTIVSTIDTNIQSIVEKHILKFNEEHKNEAREGNGAKNLGVIIMDPNNGEILAMASYPSFDLQDPQNLTEYYSEEEISAMGDKEKDEAMNSIWRNFCISDTYEPGSTAKPFTVASALEEGAITGNETYSCGGALEVGGHTIHCHNRLGDGLLTVGQGIQKSCNVVLMNIAFALGKEKWLKYNRLFNFGLKTNIDLKGEVNAAALVFGDNMGQTDLAVGSFGQGFNVTMIQIATAYCSLINGGYYYQPHVVNRILNSEGAVVEDIEPRVLKQTISGSTSTKIKEMMRSVVMEGSEGTGWTARPAGYTMGGKTGTAEKVPRNKRNYVVSFCGYVPAEDPKVLSYVVIDEPNVPVQDSARYATVLTRDIMTEVLPYLNIFMTEELSDEEKAELEERQLEFYENAQRVKEESEEREAALAAEGEEGAAAQEGGQAPASDGGALQINAGEAATGENEEDSVTDESIVPQIQKDPETGYPIDPNTGEVLDPDTLMPLAGGGSFMD